MITSPQPPRGVDRLRRRLRGLRARVRARLGAASGPHTALIVAVPLPPHIEAIRHQHLPPGDLAVPAHVTVLYPFVPAGTIDDDVAHRVDTALAGFDAFRFRLTRVEQFPGGLVYLAPEPADRFRELTERVAAYWPEHPPYSGAFSQITPHVTMAHRKLEAGAHQELGAALPLEFAASEVALVEEAGDRSWSTVCRFPLGV